MRRYADGTVLAERRNRTTGTRVMLVYDAYQDPTAPWETICRDHGGVCSHETRTLAMQFLSHPDEWCEDCVYGEGTLDGTNKVPGLGA